MCTGGGELVSGKSGMESEAWDAGYGRLRGAGTGTPGEPCQLAHPLIATLLFCAPALSNGLVVRSNNSCDWPDARRGPKEARGEWSPAGECGLLRVAPWITVT